MITDDNVISSLRAHGYKMKDIIDWLTATRQSTLRMSLAQTTDIAEYGAVNAFITARGKRPTVAELAEYIAEIRFIEADAMIARGMK